MDACPGMVVIQAGLCSTMDGLDTEVLQGRRNRGQMQPRSACTHAEPDACFIRHYDLQAWGSLMLVRQGGCTGPAPFSNFGARQKKGSPKLLQAAQA